MFDIACGLAHRVLLTKLVKLDGNICQYLTRLVGAALACTVEDLVVLGSMQIMMITREASDYMLLKEASHKYDNYNLVSR